MELSGDQLVSGTTEEELTPLMGHKSAVLRLPGNNRLQRLGDGDLPSLVKRLKRECVTGLDVSYNSISDDGAAQLADLLKEEDSALLSLDLRFNDIQAGGATALAHSLQSNCTLLALQLSGNKIGDDGGTNLANMLQVNSSLKELELASCDLGSQSVIALAVLLKVNQTLRLLDVSRPIIAGRQEGWAVHFSEMLLVNSGLLELHLGTMGLSDTGMERLCDGLQLNCSLRYLDLRCNRVTRDGMRHLAEVLRHNSTLEILDLRANRMENDGAVYLSEAIAWSGCSLKELSVCYNNIGTEGLLSLAATIKATSTLSHVYIWGNHLEEPVCLAFRDLISCGRLNADQTDVSAYEVDGHVFLAEAFNSLRRRCSLDATRKIT